jgi:hypothetical protein
VKRWIVASMLAALVPAAAGGQQWEDYDYENLEFRGIGLDFGAVWPVNVERTLSFGLRADMGFAGPRVRISPAIRFWSSTVEEAEIERLAEQIRRLCERQAGAICPPFDLGEVERSDLELAVDAHYLFPTGYSIMPYAGAGLGLHLLNGRGEAIDDTFVEDLLDTVSPALNLLGGIHLPLSSAIELLTEARFVLVSDVRYASLLIGGTWILPSPSGNPFRENPPGAGR